MKLSSCSVAALALAAVVSATAANAQTLTESLAAAYSSNPELNAARSNLRAIDENIAIARSGNRPTLTGNFSTSRTFSRILPKEGPLTDFRDTNPYSISLTLVQPIFRGFRTRNEIRGAEAAVKAGRSELQNTEQDVLLDAATAFEDVIQDRAIVQLRESDVRFLDEQVRAAEDRFEVGEGTRTDVSQAEARRASAQSALNFARATLAASEASFFADTGLEAGSLRDNFDVEKLLPSSLDAAITTGQNSHPAIIASLFNVDVAQFNVKVVEGEFLPSVNATAEGTTSFNNEPGRDRIDQFAFTLGVEVPIYQGGLVSARVRQSKEELGTSRIEVDLNRDLVRQNTVAAWATYIASVRSIQAARTEVFSAQLALQGVVEEQRVGQRTTLEVLDAQRELVSAQVTLVEAERDKDVAAFTLLSAVGRLSAQRLGLAVALYVPAEHTNEVRDKWYGFRTPDGR